MLARWLVSALVGCALSSMLEPCLAATLTTFWWEEPTLSPGTPKKDTAKNVARKANLSAQELSALSSRDVVLIIDKSHSMSRTDCTGSNADAQAHDSANRLVSRWQWCREQAANLSDQTMGHLPDGLTVVLFSGDYAVYHNADANLIQTIFSDNTPKGGTNTAAALKSQLNQYFARRNHQGDQVKPLLIAIITDGSPDNPSTLRYAITDATKQMKRPDEIAITFLQAGNDPDGNTFLSTLDEKLTQAKSRYKIVDVKSYDEINKNGLAKTLAGVIAEKHNSEVQL